jgi:hypothetical protein
LQLHQSDQSQLKLNASQTGAAVCVAGICSSLAHFVLSGADMSNFSTWTPYILSVKTDITPTLKRAGFTPPSEDKDIQKKWEYYRNFSINNKAKIK